jgi:AmmeMemoRadiSam system protein B/AmmeMemoRadiSam system protein A
MRRMVLVSMAGLLCAIAVITGTTITEAAQSIRQPVVAGSFYPQDPKSLAATVDTLMAHAQVPATKGQVIALIAPHAGYTYSGPVAAHSYALLRGLPVHRVVVIAPSHFEAFPFSSVYDGDGYATPLGRVPIDKEFAQKLASSSPLIRLSSRGHAPPSQDQGEHALEVQLPFLQQTLSDFQLVPVVMGDQSYEASRALGVALAELSRGSDTLIVASSDLSHYHTYDEASALDRKTLNAIQEWDYLTLSRNFQSRVWEACGGGPIVAAMIAADRLGANKAEVLKYATTGDVTGDHSRVVGYGAVALLKDTKRHSEPTRFSLSGQDRKDLLDIARKSVETAVKERKLFQPPADLSQGLRDDRAAFVTITMRGELRGCIGYTAAVEPLALAVRDVAVSAALRDPRFPPVKASELPELRYEISVLSPLRRVLDTNQIRVGEHGLLIKKGDYEGLLLPQVAKEQRWDRNTLLEQTAVKAGLPPKAWRDKDTDIFAFTALVFGESTVPLALTPEDPFSRMPGRRPEDQGPGLPPR